MGNVYVGPAGWAYEDWRGVVYPREKSAAFDPLGYLSHFFDCIEINSTFYRIPHARVTAGWARRAVRLTTASAWSITGMVSQGDN